MEASSSGTGSHLARSNRANRRHIGCRPGGAGDPDAAEEKIITGYMLPGSVPTAPTASVLTNEPVLRPTIVSQCIRLVCLLMTLADGELVVNQRSLYSHRKLCSCSY